MAALSLAIAANIRAVPNLGWIAVLCCFAYAVAAIWLLNQFREKRRPGASARKLATALASVAVAAPLVVIAIVLNRGEAGEAGPWLDLALNTAVLPFVLDGVCSEEMFNSSSRDLVWNRYLAPGVLLIASVASIFADLSWIAMAGWVAFGPAIVWWLMRASRPAQPRWWRTALIWIPGAPPLAAVAWGIWSLRTNDVALEGLGPVLAFLLIALIGGVIAQMRFHDPASVSDAGEPRLT